MIEADRDAALSDDRAPGQAAPRFDRDPARSRSEHALDLLRRLRCERLPAWSRHHARGVTLLIEDLLGGHGHVYLAATGDQRELRLVRVRKHVGAVEHTLGIEIRRPFELR